MRVIEFLIEEEQEGKTILQYLRGRDFSAREIRRVKFRGEGICVNHQKTNVRRILHAGDVLQVCLEEETGENSGAGSRDAKILPWPGPLEVLYQDEDLIAVNKPSDMAVHPSHGHYRDTLLNRVIAYLMEQGESTELHVVGRLDKETSGIVIFARNQLTAAGIGKQKQKGNAGFAYGTAKEYLAWVCGCPQKKEDTIQAPIGPDPATLQWMRVCPEGKPAVTHYQVLEQREKFTLVRLRLETGRTHQIRVHMAYIGHPLAGDRHYGGSGTGRSGGQVERKRLPVDPDALNVNDAHKMVDISSQNPDGSGFTHAALHAERLVFTHPITGKLLDLHAPLPEEWSYLPKEG